MRKTWPDPLSQMDHKKAEDAVKCVLRAAFVSSTCV